MKRRLFLQVSAVTILNINQVFSESFLTKNLIDFTPIKKTQGFEIADGFNLVRGVGFGDRVSSDDIDFFGDYASGLAIKRVDDKFFLFVSHTFLDTTAKKFKEILGIEGDSENIWGDNKDIFTFMKRSVGFSFLEMQGIDLLNIVLDSKENIRIHADTPAFITGKLTNYLNYNEQFLESKPFNDKDTKDKKIVRGVLSTKGGVITPWGSLLCAESNFYRFFQGHSEDLQWYKFDEYYSNEKNNINNFGYVIEYVNAKAFKRTTLGRSSFESIDITVDDNGVIVIYLCSTNGYFYKFICDSQYNEDNKLSTDFLNNGKLFVAKLNKFNDIDSQNNVIKNGTGAWVLLSLENNSIKDRFKSYEEILLDIDVASNSVGADSGFSCISAGTPYSYIIHKNLIARINHKESKHYKSDFIWEIVLDKYAGLCENLEFVKNMSSCLIPYTIRLDPKNRLWIAMGINIRVISDDAKPVGSLICMDTNTLKTETFMQLSQDEYINYMNYYGLDLVISVTNIAKNETNVYKIVHL